MKDIGSHKPIEAVLVDQPLTASEKALVEEAYGRLVVFEQGCAPYHERAKEAREIIRLNDPHQDTVTVDAEGRPINTVEPVRRIMQVQTLKSTFNNSVADQVDNMPEAKLLPERPELQQVAEDLTDVTRFIFDINKFEQTHVRRVEDFLGPGTALTEVCWDADMDYGQGNIGIFRWPIENFLWDPLSESMQEGRAVIKISWHPLSWFNAHYPEQAAYIRAEDNEHNNVGVPASQIMNDTGDEGRAMLMAYWYRLYDSKTRRYSVNVAHLAGGALLYHQKNVYAHGKYPFVMDAMTNIEGVPVGDGMVVELAPMMRYINRYIHYLDENIRMSASAKLLVDERSGVDPNDMADMSKRIVTGKNLTDYTPGWLQTAPLTSVATNMLQALQSDLKQDSGQNQFSRGETAGGVTAFGAIDALQNAGAKITRLRTQKLNTGFQEIVEQVLWLLSEFYTEKRTRLITGRDGKLRDVDMSAEHLFGERAGKHLPPPPYSVQVQVQRRNPLRVQAMNETAIKAYSMAAQAGQVFPLSALFEIIDFDGKDRILPLLREMEEKTDIMSKLAAENEQLKAGIENLKDVNSRMTQSMVNGAAMPPDPADQIDQVMQG